MCQQTRVEAVKGYYLRFLRQLPTGRDLADCPEERLYKLWEGLGYYSRARNLQKAAKAIQSEHGGRFPADYASIRALPGIGDYTAAAIASIAFDLPYPAVDGNVLRVVTRLCASRADIAKESTRAEVRRSLLPLFRGVSAGTLNQALMELGALVCLPNHAPDCGGCPLRSLCLSASGLWKEIPFKSAKKARRNETHTVFLLRCGDAWALRKRGKEGLLAGLWEFPNLPGRLDAQAALDAAAGWGCRPVSLLRHMEKTHIFTHVQWELPAWVIECQERPAAFTWAAAEEIKSVYSLPTAFRQFMEDMELIKENQNEKSDPIE
ncbi:MAG: A/G-specific adenine glycosylase [Deltaproteobacteria bacterium]|nr:A/G-specific adenine glycosylase [Deltaproteobacteria bacterium]